MQICEENLSTDSEIAQYTDNIEMDDLCDRLNNTNVEWKPNSQFLKDINLFLLELKEYDTLDIDIYELLVSCGSDLNWSMEYFISIGDLMWFKSEGKTEFIKFINDYIKELNSIIDYNQAISIHNKLCALFELQLGEEYEKFNI